MFIYIFLCYTGDYSTSSGNTCEKNQPPKCDFSISSAPAQVLQLCQHTRTAVSSPPAPGSSHTVGLKHLLLPGLLPFTCMFAFYLQTLPKELIKSLCLGLVIVFILLTTSNLLVSKVIFNLPTAGIGFLWHILGTAPVSPISEPAVGC